MLLDDALVWFDLEGALGVDVIMAPDSDVFREDCEAMTVILVGERKDEMRTSGRLWNEHRGGVFWFKSRLLAPNTQEWNVQIEWNVA